MARQLIAGNWKMNGLRAEGLSLASRLAALAIQDSPDRDMLVCPLVRRDLEIEPAYPSEDPRCERLENGSLRCEVHSGDSLPSEATPAPAPEDSQSEQGDDAGQVITR